MRRRIGRRLFVLLLGLALLVAVALFVMSRPAVLAKLVAWRLSSAIGGIVSIASVEPLGGGLFRLNGITVDAPGWPGEAGRVLDVTQLIVDCDTSALWRASVIIRRAELVDGV